MGAVERFTRKYSLLFARNLLHRKVSSEQSEQLQWITNVLPRRARTKLLKKMGKALKKGRHQHHIWSRLGKKDYVSMSIISKVMESRKGGAVWDLVVKLLEEECASPGFREKTAIERRIDRFSSALQLSRTEKQIIALMVFLNLDDVCPSNLLGCSDPQIKHIVRATQIRPKDVHRALRNNARLRTLGIVHSPKESYLNREFVLNIDAIDFIIEGGKANSMEGAFFSRDDIAEAFPLSHYEISDERKKILQSILSRKTGSHILLHGKAGTGKTSLARSLIKSVSKTAHSVPSGEKGDGESRRFAVSVARKMLSAKRAVVIVDEADRLLNTEFSFIMSGEKGDKSWMNQFLDARSGHFIWITNEVWRIPESTLRRFDFHIELPKMTPKQQVSVWNRIAKRTRVKFSSPRTFETLARKYEITPAVVETTLKAVKPLLAECKKNEANCAAIVERQLLHSMKILDLPTTPHPLVADTYSLDFLNTVPSPNEIVASIQMFARSFSDETVWLEKPLNLLFSGPPGTGKTELAKHLAEVAGRPLLMKKASDILGAYVGETEGRLKAVFEEATETRGVLLLDELDSFLRNRENAARSWEVTMVNELLTQMEHHKTIFIATTNLLKTVDPACLRRFALKVEFKYLSPSDISTVYGKFFPHVAGSLKNEQLDRVTRLGRVALGDFKVVAERLALKKHATHDELITQLEAEVKAKAAFESRPIGIGAPI